MKNIVFLMFVFLLTSCASTMPGKSVGINNSFISATIKENPDYSNENIKMYQLSIKNSSTEWVSIDSTVLGSAPTAKVLLGDKISSWIEACALEKKVSDYNTALLLGAAAVAGSAVMATSRNDTTAVIGASVALGAIGVAGAKDLMESKNKAEFQASFPDGHIFRSFLIPPKKVIQRWILIENPNKEKPVMTLISKNKIVGEISFIIE